MSHTGIVFVLLVGFGELVHANIGGHLPNLKLLPPVIDKVEWLRGIEKQSENAHRLLDFTKPPSQNNFSQINQYIRQFKNYSQLTLTDKLSITVGTLKVSPLGNEKAKFVDMPDVFDPIMDRLEDSTDKGYGIKFKMKL